MTRFWEKVDKSGECWMWTAYIGGDGYGQFGLNGKVERAHRVAYEMGIGPIPQGMQIDHLCRVRACVNPNHLEPVTQRENILRGESPSAKCARVMRCPQGHQYSDTNTARYSDRRYCKECIRIHREDYRARTI